jgi:CHASE3 domain sensor protein
MDDLKQRAAPKHAELVRLLAEQQKSQIDQQLQNVTIIDLLQELVDIERGRSEHDLLTHRKATRTTWMQVFIGVAALGVAVIALWSGVVDVNKDNAMVQGLMGLFL